MSRLYWDPRSRVHRVWTAHIGSYEETADLSRKQHTKLFQDNKAFRFNVIKGLEGVGLEAKKWDKIKAVTSNYIQAEDTWVKILQCEFNLQ